MALEQGPQCLAALLVELVHEDHAVRIAHGHRRHRERLGPHLKRDADHLPRRSVHGDLRSEEGAAPHLHGDEVHPPIDHVAVALHAATLGVHGEHRLLGVVVLPQVLGEDAKAIA